MILELLSGDRFDADEWAELSRRSGARFAGPVAEHHDGFAMWDTQYSEWSAAKMGPRREVFEEFEKAIRRQDMRFMVALHHAENWWFFPHWRDGFDASDPRYAGLYGPLHNQEWAKQAPSFQSRNDEWLMQDKPSQAFLRYAESYA